jgi:hypothetical protein
VHCDGTYIHLIPPQYENIGGIKHQQDENRLKPNRTGSLQVQRTRLDARAGALEFRDGNASQQRSLYEEVISTVGFNFNMRLENQRTRSLPISNRTT